MHYSCLTKSSPEIKRLFSYFRLFTLSAYSEPQFWARSLLTFLLCWSGYASQEFADVILQSSEGNSKVDNSRVFCLPSRGTISSMPSSMRSDRFKYVTVVAASSSWDFDYVWPFNMPDFSVFDIHTRRPYKAKPTMEEIQLYSHSNNDGSCNTTLLFDSTRALARFRILLTRSVRRDGEENSFEASVNMVSLNCLYEIVLTIHEQMNEETLAFTGKAFNRATDIVHTRLLPKFRFLVNERLGCTQPRSPWQSRIPLPAHFARLCCFSTSPYADCKRAALPTASNNSRGCIDYSKEQYLERHGLSR